MSQGNDFGDNTNVSQDGGSPFSADLQGDFTSNFGGSNTNAVSQIFKEGGFVGENKSRLIGVIAVVLAIFVGIYFYLGTGDDYGDDDFVVAEDEEGFEDLEELDDAGETEDAEVGLDDGGDESLISEDIDEGVLPLSDSSYSDAGSADYSSGATEAPSLTSPADGYSRVYDETLVPPEFSWEGSPGGWLVISQNSSMKPVSMRRKVSGNSHRLRKLLPGNWYWQVRNGAGSSGVRSLSITQAPLRVLSLSDPSEGGSLTGSGGQVTWTGDNKVSFYRVEISSSGWASPAYRFATTGTQLQVDGVAPGQYQLRVGGFSEVSGRWEYTEPVNISVQ